MAKGKKSSDTKSKGKEIENTEVIPEDPVEKIENTIVETVEVPITPENMSDQELDDLQAKIEYQKIQNHTNKEAERIRAISCPSCGTNLDLNPDDYMKKGNKPEKIECQKCERLNTVYINYKDEPESSEAEITVKPGGFAWATQLPATWKDKHVKRWVEDEAQKISENKSSLTVEGQKLFRMQYLALKKLKIVK